jgi:histone acetyltransferase (RNA polymerase elongator complex component)
MKIEFSYNDSKYRGFDIDFVGGTYFATDTDYEAEFVEGMWRQCGGTRFTDSSFDGLKTQIDNHFSQE